MNHKFLTSLIPLIIFLFFTSCELQKFEKPAKDEDSFSIIDEDSADMENDIDIYDEYNDGDEDSDIDNIKCGSVYFNGFDSYISVEHDDALNLGNTWTIEAWVMQDDQQNQSPIIRKGEGTDLPSYWIYGKRSEVSGSYSNISNGGYQYGSLDAQSVWLYSDSDKTSGKWHHIALVKSEEYLELFINGVSNSKEAVENKVFSNDGTLFLGARSNDSPVFFSGLIDEIRFSFIPRYAENFTPEKRLSADSSTTAVWHFEETSGTETASEGNKILKGILNGSAKFVNECAENEKECVNECFFEGETKCSDGILKTCGKNDGGCYVFIVQEECATAVCANNLSCAEDKCPFPGMSQCSEGKISICAGFSDGIYDWTEPEECSGKACADEFTCLSCENECNRQGDSKCTNSKSSLCVFDTCLTWNEEKLCFSRACQSASRCKSYGWKSFSNGFAKCGINNLGHLYCWDLDSLPERIGTKSDWEMITSGIYHACAIASDDIYCFGENSNGQLGIGSTDSEDEFVKITSDRKWSFVDVSHNSSCGITTLGELYCWGEGTIIPVKIGEKTDWIKTSGYCAIASDGLYCRESIFGTLKKIGERNDWEDVSSIQNRTCAIAGGELFCWGENSNGELGDGTFEDRSDPVKIGDRNDWSRIKISLNTCGIAGDELFCWGHDLIQYFEKGISVRNNIPTKTGSDLYWKDISLTYFQVCGLSGIDIYCQGLKSIELLQQSDTYRSFILFDMKHDFKWDVVSLGNNHKCGISEEKLFCWGANDEGQIGVEDSLSQSVQPLQVEARSDWEYVSAGSVHTCAIAGGELYCWGNNSYGQVGKGISTAQRTPIRVSDRTDWSYVSAGGTYTCGIAGGELFCWGSNQFGQLGDGSQMDKSLPTQIGTGSGWTMVSAYQNHTCGISDGELFCWGVNDFGQLGDGSFEDRLEPVKIGNRNDWTSIQTDLQSTCGIAGGEIYCWGEILRKLTGKALTVDQNTPLKISEDSNFKDISINFLSLYAISETGSVTVWHGDMNSDIESIFYPEKIAGLEWEQLIQGFSSSDMCAIDKNDELYCSSPYSSIYDLDFVQVINP